MTTKATELKTYSFTEEDINLITFSLRRINNTTGSLSIKNDTQNLMEYIKKLKKENN